MGNSHSDNHEPLRPIVYTARPPWLPRYIDKNGMPHFVVKALIDYNDECDRTGKSKAFWAENGMRNPLTDKNQVVLMAERIKEKDPFYYDPPVADGKSIAGSFGKDIRYNRDYGKKETEIGHLKDYQKALMEASPQYKRIIEKWKLSKEHPGLAVTPNLNKEINTRYDLLGTSGIWKLSQWYFGPRFFDKPLNEGCVEKGLCATKYAAVLGLWNTYCRIQVAQTPPWPDNMLFSLKGFMKIYMQANKNILLGSFIWGSALCLVADVRKKDDVFNHFIVSPISSLVYYELSGRNIQKSVALCFALTVGGFMWHYMRANHTGFVGISMNDTVFTPLAWKLHYQGASKKNTDELV